MAAVGRRNRRSRHAARTRAGLVPFLSRPRPPVPSPFAIMPGEERGWPLAPTAARFQTLRCPSRCARWVPEAATRAERAEEQGANRAGTGLPGREPFLVAHA